MSEQNEEEALRFDLSRSAVTYEDDPHVHVRLAPGQDGVQDGVAVRCDIDSCATCSWCAAVLLTVCLMCCQLRCALYIPWVSLIAEPGACLGDASGVLGKEWSVSLFPAMMLLSLSTSYTNMLGEEPPFPSPPLPPPFPPLRPFITLSFCAIRSMVAASRPAARLATLCAVTRFHSHSQWLSRRATRRLRSEYPALHQEVKHSTVAHLSAASPKEQRWLWEWLDRIYRGVVTGLMAIAAAVSVSIVWAGTSIWWLVTWPLGMDEHRNAFG